MKKLDDVREVFKSAKHRKPTMIFCPKCCSPKIKLATGLTIGGLAPKQYYCEECGYVGTIVMELEEDKNYKDEKEKEETDA
jgi:late competence protein required for DNA uptake (superfamily II DNA/RNA helicase)